ncbi:hypothetical protein M0Q03_01555, partial [bacterium]|nr:hypothetical protein [bacterium]
STNDQNYISIENENTTTTRAVQGQNKVFITALDLVGTASLTVNIYIKDYETATPAVTRTVYFNVTHWATSINVLSQVDSTEQIVNYSTNGEITISSEELDVYDYYLNSRGTKILLNVLPVNASNRQVKISLYKQDGTLITDPDNYLQSSYLTGNVFNYSNNINTSAYIYLFNNSSLNENIIMRFTAVIDSSIYSEIELKLVSGIRTITASTSTISIVKGIDTGSFNVTVSPVGSDISQINTRVFNNSILSVAIPVFISTSENGDLYRFNISGYIAGNSVITLNTLNGLVASLNVTVYVPLEDMTLSIPAPEDNADVLYLSQTPTLKNNQTLQSSVIALSKSIPLSVSFYPADAQKNSITYSVTNGQGIVSIANGVIRALNEGTAQISVSASFGVESIITRTFYVTVYNPIVAIYVNRTNISLKNINTLGCFDYDKAQANFTVTALRSVGSIAEDITNNCNYSITNLSGTVDTTIISVASGIITGIKQGEVNILISFTEGDTLSEITVNGNPLVREFNDRTHYQTCTVTVTDTDEITNLALNNVSASQGLYYNASLVTNNTKNKISANVYPTTAINTSVIYAYQKNSVDTVNILDVNLLKIGTVTPYLTSGVTAGKTSIYVIPQGAVKLYYTTNSNFASTAFANYAEYTQYIKTYIAETGIYYITNSEPSTILDDMFNKLFKIAISASFDVVVADGLTYDTAYQIKTALNLYDVRNGLDKYYIIKNDINLVGYADWAPIGTELNPFIGKIFGSYSVISNRKTILKYSKIINLNIQKTLTNTENADSAYIGLFGYVGEGAIICDLDVAVSKIEITASSYTSIDTIYAGVIAGFAEGSVSPYTDFATVNEEYAVTDSAIIYNCGATYVASNVNEIIINYTGNNANVNIGGLVGYSAGIIANLSSIAFNSNSYITNSNYLYTSGNIAINSTGLINAGGLIGYNDNTALLGTSDKIKINTTTNTVTFIKASKLSTEINTDIFITVSNTVISNSSVGGLVGINNGIIMGANAQANITGLNNIGGLVGINNGKLYNASSSSKVVGYVNVGGAVGINNVIVYNTDFKAYDNVESNGISISKVVGINNVGGLVGFNNAGTIVYSSAISYFPNRDINDGSYFGDVVVNGGIDALISAGGLVGLTSGKSVIEQSYATINTQIYSASDTTISAIGGLIGSVENGGTITEGSNSISIKNVYSAGIIKNMLDTSILGGLIGYVYDSDNATYYTLTLSTAYTVAQNYTNGTSTANASIGSQNVTNNPVVGGSASQVLYLSNLYFADINSVAVTDNELKNSTLSIFEGWNFATYTDGSMNEGTFIWDIYNSYPVLLKPENTYTNITAPDIIVLEVNTEENAIRTESNSMVLFYDAIDTESNTYSIENLVYIYYGYTDEFDEIISMFLSSDFSMSILSGDLVIGIDGKNIIIKTTGTADIKIKANKNPAVYAVLQICVLPKISSIVINDENGNDITLNDYNSISMRKDSVTQLNTLYLDEEGNAIYNSAFGVIYSSDNVALANVISSVPVTNDFGSTDMENWTSNLYYLPISPNAIIESGSTILENYIANFIAMPVVIATFNDLVNGGTYSVYVPIRDFVQDSDDTIKFEVQLIVGATMIDVTPYDNEIEKIQILNLTGTVYTDNIAVDTESDYLGRVYLYGSNVVEGYEGFILNENKTQIVNNGNTYLTITEGDTELLSGQLITGFNIAVSNYFTEQIEQDLQIELLFTPFDNLDINDNIINESLIKVIKITINSQQILRTDITHFAGGEIINGVYNAEEYATTTIVNSQNGLLKIFTYPLYADYDGIDLVSSVMTQNGQEVSVQFEQRIASYLNSYYYQQPNTSAITIANGITLRKFSYVYTENNVSTNMFNGWFYIRTLLPTEVDLGTQFTVTASFYKLDESNNKQTVYTQSILLVTAQMPGVSIDFEQEYVARGTSIIIDLYTNGVSGDALLLAFSGEDYESDEYAELHSVSAEKINNVWYLKIGPSIKAGTIITVQASISEYVNGILETKITEEQITVVDFVITGMTEETVGTGSVYRMETGSPRSLKVLLITQRYIYDENAYSSIDSTYLVNIENEIQNQISALEEQYSTLLNTLGTLSQVWKRLSIGINDTLNINNLVGDGEYFSVRFDTRNYTIITPVKVNTVDILVRGEIEYTYYNGVPYMAYVNSEGDSVINVDDIEIEISETYTINKDFNFDFWLNTTEDSPQPITSLEELKNMSAGANYILTNDIVINEAWTPLQVDIAMLDGNSYTIFFKNFDETTLGINTVALIGLFSQVNSGTVLKNITIALPATIEINATAFTSVTFGMLTAVNNGGIITNCAITSEYQDLSNTTQHTTNITINTSDTIGGNVVSTLVGGLVGSNSGYISNSRVGGYTELYRLEDADYVVEEILSTINIFAKGSIGGFVGINTNIISNSFYSNGTIENVSTYGVNAYTGGFVENNSGTIFGCYAEGLAGSYTLSNDVKNSNPTLTEGGIKTYGDAGGFIYFNSGTITNSYSNIPILARRAGGFAYENRSTGTIDQTYSLSLLIESERSDYYGPFIGRNNLNIVNNDSTCTVTNSYYRDIGYVATDEVGIRVNKLDFSSSDVFVGFGFSGSMTSFVQGGSIWVMESIDTDRLAQLQSIDDQDKTPDDVLTESLLELVLIPKLVSADSIAISLRMPITTEEIVQGESYTYYYPVTDTTSGTVNNPILIKTAEEFNLKIVKYADYIPATETETAYVKFDKYIRIIADLDFNDYTTINTNVKGDTLTDVNNTEIIIYTQGMLTMGIIFKGNLDGNGMTMQNVKFASVADTFALQDTLTNYNLRPYAKLSSTERGLFARVEGGVVKNLNISTSGSMGASNIISVGTLAGVIKDSVVLNIKLTGSATSTSQTDIYGNNYAGGLAGRIIGTSIIMNITSNLSVSATYSTSDSGNVIVEGNQTYVIYSSYQDENLGYALKTDVSYAGGIAGIINIVVRDMSTVSDGGLSTGKNITGTTIDDTYIQRLIVSGANTIT